jgi:hypothetical protein
MDPDAINSAAASEGEREWQFRFFFFRRNQMLTRMALLVVAMIASSFAGCVSSPMVPFTTARRQTVGVDLYHGQAWKGMRPCVENLGFTLNLHDVPLDKKFLSEIGILIIPGCNGNRPFSKEEVKQVSDFVAAGGGLLCAAQAWSWVYKQYGNKPIETFPINALGRSLGFVITGKNIGHPDPATADAEVFFGEIKKWNGGAKGAEWWPSEVQPLAENVTAILRDPSQHPIALRGEHGAGLFVVAGHDALFENNPEAFEAVLRFLTPMRGDEGNPSSLPSEMTLPPSKPQQTGQQGK